MKFKTKLTLEFSIYVGCILAVFSLLVYYFSANNREIRHYSRLRNRAMTTVKMFSKDIPGITPTIVNTIRKNDFSILSKERVDIFDSLNRNVYSSNDDSFKITNQFIDNIRKSGEIKFKYSGREGVGYCYNSKSDNLVIVLSAYDKFGYERLVFLRNLLMIMFAAIMLFTIILSRIYANSTIAPLINLVNQIKRISGFNLNPRINNPKRGAEEMAIIATEFNQMLDRLETSFEMQKNFVSNASHEFRTPLSKMISKLEVSLMNPDIEPETKELLSSLLIDIWNINKLTNGLLFIAQANLDPSQLPINIIRTDELILQIVSDLLKANKDYEVNLEFKVFPEDENKLLISVNEQLIYIAIYNIVENACKYSGDHKAQVEINVTDKEIVILISDTGIGIPEEEIERVFETFYRAGNVNKIAGHGIGLALSRKIIHLHQGKFLLESKLNTGTTVTITLPISS